MSENNNSKCDGTARGEKYLHGVCCDVKTCVYHDCGEHCTASEIVISPSFATSSADTACSTFKPKK